MPFIDYEPPFRYEKGGWFAEKKHCLDPSHNPPGMIVLKPGTHTYQCPSCGEKSVIIVPEITCSATLNTK